MSILLEQAIRIWRAGVAAVAADQLVMEAVDVGKSSLRVAGREYPLDDIHKILVVGGGKGAARMARGLELALAPLPRSKLLEGWVHTFDESEEQTKRIHLWQSRPWACNQPTARGVDGTREMLRRISASDPADLVIALITGGASAMIVCPVNGVTLEEKQQLAQFVSAAGGNIRELNAIRTCVSRVKGGGLRRASTAENHITLLISDVLGDPLDVIGSAPMLPIRADYGLALKLIDEFVPPGELPRIRLYLRQQQQREPIAEFSAEFEEGERANHFVLGNLERACESAAREAQALGFQVELVKIDESEPTAEVVAERCLQQLGEIRRRKGAWCLLGGGEPTVKLVESSLRGRGGRNQQLITAILANLQSKTEPLGDTRELAADWVVLSAGTDGEDGPTDAAGGFLNPEIVTGSASSSLEVADVLRHNNAYPYLDQIGALFRTGATQTNVCDLRVILSVGR
jgi:glycerate 2-kinase